jgi:thiol-disulfide isomerase/thioredoxin
MAPHRGFAVVAPRAKTFDTAVSTTTDPAQADRADAANAATRTQSPGRAGSSAGPRVALVILVAGIAAIAVFRCARREAASPPGVAAAHAGCPKDQRDCLPDVSYIDTTGAAYPRESLLGKVVLVNFWATWCAPCEKEIPDLSKAYQKYKSKGVVFLGILIDNPDSQQLLNFQSDHDMTYPVVRANRDVMASYNNPDAYPTTFVYDRSGKQVFTRLGQVRERDLDTLLATLTAQN